MPGSSGSTCEDARMLVIAHRGARNRAPENTIAAFDAALEDGAKALEFDVLVTKDGVPVVCHDEHLMRVAGVEAWISRMSLVELQGLDVGRVCAGWEEPARIPTLEEVLARYAGRAELFIELKAVIDEAVGFRPSSIAADASWPLLSDLDGLVVSSFDPSGPALIREASAGRIPIAHTVSKMMSTLPFLETATTAGASQVHLEISLVSASLVREAAKAGLEILAFTVNTLPEAEALDALGVAGIFTDAPGPILRSLAAGNEQP